MPKVSGVDAAHQQLLELDFVEADVEFANKEQIRQLLVDLDDENGRLLDGEDIIGSEG